MIPGQDIIDRFMDEVKSFLEQTKPGASADDGLVQENAQEQGA